MSKLSDTVISQILDARQNARCNMFDTVSIQRYAFDHDLYELVCLIEEDKSEYVSFILHGKRDSE
ncbi:hypothetical protein AGMMS50284_4390 [Clostridia bacterium]|nr:hypothetical protein AGMMS50284_4390 [Clostridia bacterium]